MKLRWHRLFSEITDKKIILEKRQNIFFVVKFFLFFQTAELRDLVEYKLLNGLK